MLDCLGNSNPALMTYLLFPPNPALGRICYEMRTCVLDFGMGCFAASLTIYFHITASWLRQLYNVDLNKVDSKLRQLILLPLKHFIQFSCLQVALVFNKVDSKRRASPSITSEIWTFIHFTSALTFPQMANCLWFVIWSGLNCVGSSFYRKNHLLPHHSLLTQTAV